MKKFFENLGYKMQRFMIGRYGVDELYRFSLIIYIVLILINAFVRNNIANIVLYVITTAFLIFTFFRVFSKNISARRNENNKYLKCKNKVTTYTNLQKNKWKFRKTHIFKKCPNCKRTLKLPRKSGKHTVNCPVCHQSFEIKVR